MNSYVHFSEAIRKQTKEKRRDLFHQALTQSHDRDGGQFGEENRYLQKNVTVSGNLSEKDRWACPVPKDSTGGKKGDTCTKNSTVSLKGI